VFLCHNSRDRDLVRQLRDALAYLGISSWMDSDMIVPGDQPVAEIERIIDQVRVVAVIVGGHAMGPWQRQEYYAFLGRVAHASNSLPPVRLVPVLIPGATGSGDLPPFARTYNIVDLRTDWADGVARLAAAVRPGFGGDPSSWARRSRPQADGGVRRGSFLTGA
jgi:hypothetical protein